MIGVPVHKDRGLLRMALMIIENGTATTTIPNDETKKTTCKAERNRSFMILLAKDYVLAWFAPSGDLGLGTTEAAILLHLSVNGIVTGMISLDPRVAGSSNLRYPLR